MNRVRKLQQLVHQMALESSGRPARRLMRLVSDSAVLEAAWKQVAGKGHGRTAGEDGLCAANILANEDGPEAFLHDLAVRLTSGQYVPGAVRRFEIPKPKNPSQKRPLVILTLADRVVHTAIKLVLEPLVDARLGKRCYGFRPGRSRFDELVDVRRMVQQHPHRYAAALTTDIASCFDRVDHDVVRTELRKLLDDGALMGLVDKVLLQVGAGTKGWLRKRRIGLLQGSALSPILANLALAPFDEKWRRDHGNDFPLFRYADDLLVLAPHMDAACGIRRPLARTLRRQSRMELSLDKTTARPLREGVCVLGMRIQRHRERTPIRC